MEIYLSFLSVLCLGTVHITPRGYSSPANSLTGQTTTVQTAEVVGPILGGLTVTDVKVLQVVFEDFITRQAPLAKAKEAILVVDIETAPIRYLVSEAESGDGRSKTETQPSQSAMVNLVQRNRCSVFLHKLRRIKCVRVTELAAYSLWDSMDDVRADYPNAAAYAYIRLPGYSPDGHMAAVEFSFGPSAHGATAQYTLVRKRSQWEITAREIMHHL